jgi:phytoene synthase
MIGLLPRREKTGPRERSAADGYRDAYRVVVAGLAEAAAALVAENVAVPPLEGKLLRPLVAYGLVPPALRSEIDGRFWHGALAVQMAHEASLLHDDILDGADVRRGMRTLQAEHGEGAALVLGDQYLTGSYRAASGTDSAPFVDSFIRAVERTVAGEVAQAKSAGRHVSAGEYRDMLRGKSGELFGAAATLWGILRATDEVGGRRRFGLELGTLYQQVDDLLDYCPEAATGKPPLQDYRQRKWTFVLEHAAVTSFDLPVETVLDRVFLPLDGGLSAARRALAELSDRRGEVLEAAHRLSPGDRLLTHIVDAWLEAAEAGVAAQERRMLGAARLPQSTGARSATPDGSNAVGTAHVRALANGIGGPDDWGSYFARHARTFHLAARLFPAEPRGLVTGVYAYCRFTDDLVDTERGGSDRAARGAALGAWRTLSLHALQGSATGIPLLDEVLGASRRRGVDPSYVEALLDGMEADLGATRYDDWDALDRYAFQVAGSVGGWITQLFGMRDAELLEHAHALGRAMQLTNIARDVGEDWRRGRLYLPASVLAHHGLSSNDIGQLVSAPGRMPASYRAVIEQVVEHAEHWYHIAWPGIRALPGWYRRPVAAAAEAYRGIHREIRRQEWDNLHRRARTTLPRKLVLAAAGLARGGL